LTLKSWPGHAEPGSHTPTRRGALVSVVAAARSNVGPDPKFHRLTLFGHPIDPNRDRRGAVKYAANDNWDSDATATEITRVGAEVGANPIAQNDHVSAALIISLEPGVYTFIAQGNVASSATFARGQAARCYY
jgi:hypothetical protein